MDHEEEKKEPSLERQGSKDKQDVEGIEIMPSFRKSKSFTESAATLLRDSLNPPSPTESTKKRIEIGKMIADVEKQKIDEVDDDSQSEADDDESDSDELSSDDSED